MSKNTCTDIIVYQDFYEQQEQEACKRRRNDNINYEAKPISFYRAEDFKGDEPLRKRRRRTYPQNIDETVQINFSLHELYKYNSIEEMKVDKEKGVHILDTEELLKNLNGWTVEISKRQEKNGKYSRVDKLYRHPKSEKKLRSLVQVKNLILEKSLQRIASDNGEGSSQGVNVGDDGIPIITASEDMTRTA